jgi:hypothetical protein
MDIDVSALKALVREKDLSLDLVVESIEQALLVAYHRTEGAAQRARVTLDRKTGHVTVWAAETDEDGVTQREFDDTPDGFGRIAATTAKQVLLARLREAEGDVTLSEGELAEGVRLALRATHNLAEGAGAASIAAAAKLGSQLQGLRVACVMTGGNIDLRTLQRIVDGEQERAHLPVSCVRGDGLQPGRAGRC